MTELEADVEQKTGDLDMLKIEVNTRIQGGAEIWFVTELSTAV